VLKGVGEVAEKYYLYYEKGDELKRIELSDTSVFNVAHKIKELREKEGEIRPLAVVEVNEHEELVVDSLREWDNYLPDMETEDEIGLEEIIYEDSDRMEPAVIMADHWNCLEDLNTGLMEVKEMDEIELDEGDIFEDISNGWIDPTKIPAMCECMGEEDDKEFVECLDDAIRF